MQGLHFSHVSAFEDRYDGIFNCLDSDDYYDVNNNGEIVRIDVSKLDSRSADNSTKLKAFVSDYQKAILAATGVSCWRIDDHESHAMWRVFTRSDCGVAIKSTAGDLIRSISTGGYRVVLRQVKYIDYNTDKIPINNLMNAFFYKSNYFEHEKEIRLICYQQTTSEFGELTPNSYLPLPNGGIVLSVNLSQLVKSIVVSPYAPEWFGELVKRVVRTYGLDVPVLASKIILRKT
jgi:hypothetical protein